MSTETESSYERTEWAVRWGYGQIEPHETEKDACRVASLYPHECELVSRTVTAAAWSEVSGA